MFKKFLILVGVIAVSLSLVLCENLVALTNNYICVDSVSMSKTDRQLAKWKS